MHGRQWSILSLGLVLLGLATGALMLVVLIVPGTGDWGTTFAGGSTAAFAADLAAGAALVLVGALLLQAVADRGLAVLAITAGLAWLAADLSGWHDGPAAVRAMAAIAAAAIGPLLLHLATAAPPGQPRWRPERVIVLTGYAVVLALAIAAALVGDPRVDGGCWRDCRANPFLVVRVPGMGPALRDGLALATTYCGLGMAGIAMTRLVRASRGARARRWPLLATSVALGATLATYALRGLADPVLRPEVPFDTGLFLILAGAVTTFAAALAWTVIQGRELIAELGELGAAGADDPVMGGRVSERLARVAGDPGLSIAYRLGQPDRWVDADGNQTETPHGGPRRAIAVLMRGGETIAAVTHDPSVMMPAYIEAALRPATLLAIENERLRAGILAELEALRVSRGLVVAAGDRERSRLERDLHDGAQQRLLALSYDLRMARTAAIADGLEPEARQVDVLIASARAAHEELRELAHGIYPAVLAEAGLGPALETLARRAGIPLDLTVDPARADPQAENAAYAVVAAAVRDATALGATEARVEIVRGVAALELTVTDDAPPERAAPDGLADRIGAAGGRFRVSQVAGRRRLEASIPCG